MGREPSVSEARRMAHQSSPLQHRQLGVDSAYLSTRSSFVHPVVKGDLSPEALRIAEKEAEASRHVVTHSVPVPEWASACDSALFRRRMERNAGTADEMADGYLVPGNSLGDHLQVSAGMANPCPLAVPTSPKKPERPTEEDDSIEAAVRGNRPPAYPCLSTHLF